MNLSDDDLPGFPQKWEQHQIPDALQPTLTKFKWSFIEEQLNALGLETVCKVLYGIEADIVRGNLSNLRMSGAWKIFLATARRVQDEERIRKLVEQRKNALHLLFEEGDPYKIGEYELRHDRYKGWYVNSKPADWLSKMWLESKAMHAGWRVVPLDERAKRRLLDFPMLPQ